MKRTKKMSDEFEKAFSDFLERDELDAAQETWFTALRFAFAEGWKAAGGDAARIYKIIPLKSPAADAEDSRPADERNV